MARDHKTHSCAALRACAMLRVAVAHTLLRCGATTFAPAVVEVLADVLIRYMGRIVSPCMRLAESAGRAGTGLPDLAVALELLAICPDRLLSFVTDGWVSHSVPGFQESPSIFASAKPTMMVMQSHIECQNSAETRPPTLFSLLLTRPAPRNNHEKILMPLFPAPPTPSKSLPALEKSVPGVGYPLFVSGAIIAEHFSTNAVGSSLHVAPGPELSCDFLALNGYSLSLEPSYPEHLHTPPPHIPQHMPPLVRPGLLCASPPTQTTSTMQLNPRIAITIPFVSPPNDTAYKACEFRANSSAPERQLSMSKAFLAPRYPARSSTAYLRCRQDKRQRIYKSNEILAAAVGSTISNTSDTTTPVSEKASIGSSLNPLQDQTTAALHSLPKLARMPNSGTILKQDTETATAAQSFTTLKFLLRRSTTLATNGDSLFALRANGFGDLHPIFNTVANIPEESTKTVKRADDTRCICNTPHLDDGSFMVCCDGCSFWFHGRCVGVVDGAVRGGETWHCARCRPNKAP